MASPAHLMDHTDVMCFHLLVGIMVMEMPRRAGKRGRFLANSSNKVNGGISEIVCRVVPIMERFFSSHPKIIVYKVNMAWDEYIV